jgi:hypothetical protein
MADSGITRLDAIEPRRGAAVLLEVLRSEACRYIFGNPGTTELALMDALTGAPDIGYIWGLQEASVVAMADGYASASGRPGFVNLHTAGGLGHGMGALINARVSNTPLVVTAGLQDTRHNLTDPLLSGDLVRIAGPAMKWATEIINPDQIPVLVRRAFHDCTAAPSGPVFGGAARVQGVPALVRRARPRPDLCDGTVLHGRHQGVAGGPAADARPQARTHQRGHRGAAGNRGHRAGGAARGPAGPGKVRVRSPGDNAIRGGDRSRARDRTAGCDRR